MLNSFGGVAGGLSAAGGPVPRVARVGGRAFVGRARTVPAVTTLRLAHVRDVCGQVLA